MRITVAAFTLGFLAACSGQGPVSPPTSAGLAVGSSAPGQPGGGVASVRMSPPAATIVVGQSQRFTAVATNRNGSPVTTPIQWSISDPAIARVEPGGLATGVAPGTARIRATAGNGVFQEATVVVQPAGSGGSTGSGSGSCAAPAGSQTPAPTVAYGQGFERGPIGSETTPGLRATADPAVLMEWQAGVTRTGRGAYHMRGGDMVGGDATIHNEGKSHPFGGLEVWAGGAFCFVSFPQSTARPVWLMVPVPTDGVAGADDKPVAAISANGRLQIRGTNSNRVAMLDLPLETNRWYYVIVHGRNGIAKTQELFLYDGATRALLGRTAVVLDVTGTYRNRITKWGFGTPQDSSGLEYYLDDIYHATGGTNPGPVQITP